MIVEESFERRILVDHHADVMPDGLQRPRIESWRTAATLERLPLAKQLHESGNLRRIDRWFRVTDLTQRRFGLFEFAPAAKPHPREH